MHNNCIGYEKFSRKRSIKDVSRSYRMQQVPTIDLSNASSIRQAFNLYQRYQILLIKGADNHKRKGYLTELVNLLTKYSDTVSKTWSVENIGTIKSKSTLTFEDALNTLQADFKPVNASDKYDKSYDKNSTDHHIQGSQLKHENWYISFILQNNEELLQELMALVPYQELPIFPKTVNSEDNRISPERTEEESSLTHELESQRKRWRSVSHTSPVWIFCGRNTNSNGNNIQGRVEHTDSVKHSGTWHYQLAGTKIWFVRPLEDSDEWPIICPELRNDNIKGSKYRKLRSQVIIEYDQEAKTSEIVKSPVDQLVRLKVECQDGDMLLINTRLWWHSTELPSTDDAKDCVSLSYARDFYLVMFLSKRMSEPNL